MALKYNMTLKQFNP